MTYYPPGYWGDVVKTPGSVSNRTTGVGPLLAPGVGKVRLLERYLRKGSVLDVGCGDGKFLWGLDAGRWRRTGIEPSRRVVELVRAADSGHRLRDRGPVLGAAATPVPSTRSRSGTCWSTFRTRDECCAGSAICCGPRAGSSSSLPNLSSLQARIFRRHWYAFDDVPRHLFHYSPRSLALLLEQEGFEVRERLGFSRIIGFHCLKHSLVNWSESLFGSRIPYYLLKPILPLCALLERAVRRSGIITLVVQNGARAGRSPK